MEIGLNDLLEFPCDNVTRTEHRVDSDEKGELLRSRWTGIRVTGPVPFEPNINKALDNYTAKESKQFAASNKKMLSDAKLDHNERAKYGATFFPAFENNSDINSITANLASSEG